MRPLLALISIILLLKPALSKGGVSTKIFEGEFADPGQFPFIVSLRYLNTYEHYCGGTILAKSWVLTAAHCVAPLKPHLVVIIAGTIECNEGRDRGKGKRAARFILGPGYKEIPRNIINDIALIQMAEPFVFSQLLQPVQIGTLNVHAPLIAAGWGIVSRRQDVPSPILKYVYMEVVETSHYCNISNFSFCASTVGGSTKATTCTADSGGPVVDASQGKLVGVTSFGWIECEDPFPLFAPDQYTKVDVFVDWIKKYVKGI